METIPIELVGMIFCYLDDYLSILNLVCVDWHNLASHTKALTHSKYAAYCAVKNWHYDLFYWVVDHTTQLPLDLHIIALECGDVDMFELLVRYPYYKIGDNSVDLALLYGQLDLAKSLMENRTSPLMFSEDGVEELARCGCIDELDWLIEYYLDKSMIVPDICDLTRIIIKGAMDCHRMKPLELVEKSLIPLLTRDDLLWVFNSIAYRMEGDFGIDWINHIAEVRSLEDNTN